MPLPGTGVLTLQGHSRPGDTVQSKPKQAMIVRLSPKVFELLNASSNQPTMDFEFGEHPGIHIGGNFFPVRPQKENLPHELFLRASSAAKPMAPLKLYALVTGKFSVERDLRELDEPEMDRHRFGDVPVGKKQRDRKTWPTETVGTVKKEQKPVPSHSSTFRKAVPSADRQLLSNTHAVHSRLSSPNPTHTTTKELAPLRRQLIHSLALQEQSTNDIIKLVGGPECSSSLRRDILILLKDVAEQPQLRQNTNGTGPKSWRLKTQSWLEVRPYEWPGLTEQNKTAMARSARLALSSLGISEKDEAWNHVRYRNSSGITTTTPISSTSKPVVKKKSMKIDGMKRSASSKDKAAPSKTKGEVVAKDEGVRTPAKNKNVTQAEHQASPPATSTTRRLPGSGFKVKKTSSAASPAPSSSASRKPAISADSPSKDKEFPVPSARSGASTPVTQSHKDVPGSSGSSTTAIGRVKTVKDHSTDSDLDRDSDKAKVKARDKDPDGHQSTLNRTKGQANTDESERMPVGLKRKRYPDSDREILPDFGAEKRRKTDDKPVPLSSKEQGPRSKDLSLPKKPDTLPPRPKIKKEPSPTTAVPLVKQKEPLSKPGRHSTPKIKESPPLSPSRPPMTSHARSASHSSSTPSCHRREPSSPTTNLPAKANGSASKQRRKSPIYTSSDEDEDVRLSKKPRREAPSTSTSNSQPSASDPQSQSKAEPTLRERYRARYPAYITAFQQLIIQQEKARALEELRGEKEYIMYDDPEVLSDEEYEELVAEHDALRSELEEIREEHARVHGFSLAA